MIFFQMSIKYSIHHPLSADKVSRFLALILFEIWHLQNLSLIFQRAVILQAEIISEKKKIRVSDSTIFP